MYEVSGYSATGDCRETITCSATGIGGAYKRLGGSSAWADVKIEGRRIEIMVTRAGCKGGIKVSEIWDPTDFSINRVGHRCPRCS